MQCNMNKHTRSAIFPTHSPFAVTSPIFSPLAKALYIGVRVEVDVTAATFYKKTRNVCEIKQLSFSSAARY